MVRAPAVVHSSLYCFVFNANRTVPLTFAPTFHSIVMRSQRATMGKHLTVYALSNRSIVLCHLWKIENVMCVSH